MGKVSCVQLAPASVLLYSEALPLGIDGGDVDRLAREVHSQMGGLQADKGRHGPGGAGIGAGEERQCPPPNR